MKAKFIWILLICLSTFSTSFSKEPSPNKTSYRVLHPYSFVGFEAQYFELTEVIGRFEKYKGSITSENGRITSIQANIKTSSITTSNRKRDASLQQESLLHTSKFPNMTFRSTSIQQNNQQLQVRGILVLKHEKHEIVLKGKLGSIIENKDQTKSLGLSLKGSLLRQNFGLNHDKVNREGHKEVGDKINLIIHLMARSDGSERKVQTRKTPYP